MDLGVHIRHYSHPKYYDFHNKWRCSVFRGHIDELYIHMRASYRPSLSLRFYNLLKPIVIGPGRVVHLNPCFVLGLLTTLSLTTHTTPPLILHPMDRVICHLRYFINTLCSFLFSPQIQGWSLVLVQKVLGSNPNPNFPRLHIA